MLAVVPLKSRNDLWQIVLSLLDQILQYAKSLSYVAFDNGFQDSKRLPIGIFAFFIPAVFSLN
jgi:hypothetical protein